jgi:hypothetical protein
MGAPFSITPSSGADLNGITLAADIANGKVVDARLGSQVFGSNGKRFVYAQANAVIGAATAVATVNATTFLATASAGAYLSPPVAMAVGDRGWFSVASV